jgi:hypothetical protein
VTEARQVRSNGDNGMNYSTTRLLKLLRFVSLGAPATDQEFVPS